MSSLPTLENQKQPESRKDARVRQWVTLAAEKGQCEQIEYTRAWDRPARRRRQKQLPSARKGAEAVCAWGQKKKKKLPALDSLQSAAEAFGTKHKKVESKGWAVLQKHVTQFARSRRDSKLAYMMAMQNGFGQRHIREGEEVSAWFSDQARRASIMGFEGLQDAHDMLASSESDSDDDAKEEEKEDESCLPREKFWQMMNHSLDHENKSLEPEQSPSSRYARQCLSTFKRPEPLLLKLWQSNNGKVELAGAMMGDSMAKAVADSLGSAHSITAFKSFLIGRNRLTDKGLAPLLRQIACPYHLHALMTLDLSHNKMRGESVALVCEILSKTNVLAHLFLEDCGLGDGALVSVCDSVAHTLRCG
jgi:hypothetical protein